MVASRLSIVAKERWRKRKADMEETHNEKEEQSTQRGSLVFQNEVAECPSHSSLTTDNVQSKDSPSVAFTSNRKVSKGKNMIVRRSNRLRSLGFFGKRQGKEAVQHIDLTDCDEDKEVHVDPISLKPIRSVSSSEIDVDCPIHTADGPKNSALTNVKSKLSQAFYSKRKTLMAKNMIVRQSDQFKSLGSFGKRQGKEGIHHVDPTDCDRHTELHVEPICPEPIRNVSSSEMIVDHLVQIGCKRPFASEATPTSLNYKILYTDSVKKIEALTEENYQQAQKLHYMFGKVKIYENVIAKDMVAFSNGWRATGAMTNVPDGTVKHHPEAPALNSARAPKPFPVKRKYSVKRRKKS